VEKCIWGRKQCCRYLQAFLLLSQKLRSECYHLVLQEHLQKMKALEVLKEMHLRAFCCQKYL